MKPHTLNQLPIKESKNKINFSLKFSALFLFVIIAFYPVISLADESTDIEISGTVLSTPENSIPDSSAGGAATFVNPEILVTEANFTGIAYPNSKVVLLSAGVKVAETIADKNARFSIKYSAFNPGVKVFSVVAEDPEGERSILLTFPMTIKKSTSTSVSKVFVPPTCTLDSDAYVRGENVTAHGYSAPTVHITLNVDEKIDSQTTADEKGFYKSNFKTYNFVAGNHFINARASLASDSTKESGFGKIVNFLITLTKGIALPGSKDLERAVDMNNDSVVSAADFSILAYWYGKPDAPKNVDINADGKIDAADFSILAYYWNE